jgi:hypothetical protein
MNRLLSTVGPYLYLHPQIPRESITADFVEIYFRDQYLGRCDMWRLGISLETRCIYVDQKITFVGCIGATIKTIYIKGRRVSGRVRVRNFHLSYELLVFV